MAIRYTKKKQEDEQRERTVPADDFMKRLVSMKKDPERLKELPRTEIPK